MDRHHVVSLINSCTKSRAYFRALKWEGRRHCPWCLFTRKVYRLSDGRFRCARCRKPFTEFSNTYLSRVRMPLNEVAYLMEMFTLGVPAYRKLKRSDYSRPTVQRIYKIFQEAIYDYSMLELKQLSGEIEMDEAMFGGYRPGKRGWGAAGKTVVFGIYQRNGKVVTFPV